MKQHEALYDWPMRELERLADSGAAEAFATTLSGVAEETFTRLAERMRGLGVDLKKAKVSREHSNGWEQIRECLEQFSRDFHAFPDCNIGKFRIFVGIAKTVADSGVPLDSTIDIDENLFAFRELPNSIPLHWFHRENAASFEESVSLFSCSALPTTEAEIETDTISPKYAFHFLAALPTAGSLIDHHIAVVKKSSASVPMPAVDAFVKLLLLAAGKPIHMCHRYQQPPSVINIDSIRIGEPFHQWNDVIYVLSEYNSRDDLLLKFITAYHVVENLMYKMPIVELETNLTGKMFSIRDFKRLYESVDKKEADAIGKLFAVISGISTGTTTFKERWLKRWRSISPSVPSTDIDVALITLGLKFKFSSFNTPAEFAKLVYSIRNAIVHNKETEFHLTHASVDTAFSAIIEKFLIPCLEEVCFEVIGRRVAEFWYSQDKLLFYGA
jgi:hypothetical protein